MKISYNEATAKGCSDLELDLKLCEEAGFDYIEIRLDMLREYLEAHPLSELAAFFKSSRLKPHAMNALYLYPAFLDENDDPARQNALLDEFKLGCEAAAAIGSHYFIVVPPLQRDPHGGPFIGDKEETHRECIRILKRLGQMARPYGVNLCFELVGFERSSVRTIQEADRIIRGVDLKNVGFVFDSYNIYLNGCKNNFDDLHLVQPEKIFAAHLMSGEDVPIGQMGQDKRCFPDHGVVDIDNFLQNLNKTGYDGMVSIETFNPSYWEKEPGWVIKTAYETTRAVLERNGCLSYR